VVHFSNNGSSPRRARRRDTRRDEILRAAAGMFRDRGFADTGMRDIAEAANLSAANLYHYFKGKDEILYYCQDRAVDRMLEAIGRAQRERGPAPARLRGVLLSHIRTLLDEIEGATAHLQVEALSPVLRAQIVAKRDRYEHALRRLIADGVKRGELVASDPALTARAMLGALNSTVTWFDPTGAKSADGVGAAIVDYLIRGVAATPDARARRRQPARKIP